MVLRHGFDLHGRAPARWVGTIRRKKRMAKHDRRRVGIEAADRSVTGMAGLVRVDEMVSRLGLATELDPGIGPIKQRMRVVTGGPLLVGMASAQPLGQDCLAGLDRVHADVGSVLLAEAPLAPSTTAGRLGGCFGPDPLRGIETGLAGAYRRWLTLVPAAVRAALVTRHPTIDLDASDIEVYGTTAGGRLELRRRALRPGAPGQLAQARAAVGDVPDGGQRRRPPPRARAALPCAHGAACAGQPRAQPGVGELRCDESCAERRAARGCGCGAADQPGRADRPAAAAGQPRGEQWRECAVGLSARCSPVGTASTTSGAAFGYTGVRGYHPQLATCAQSGQVLMSRRAAGPLARPVGRRRS